MAGCVQGRVTCPSWGAPPQGSKTKRGGGGKIRISSLNLAFSGPKSGRKCYITPAFSRVPYKGDKIKAGQKRAEIVHHPYILGVLHVMPAGDGTNDATIAEALPYPLGYGPSSRSFYTGVALVFGPIWFSSTIGFS